MLDEECMVPNGSDQGYCNKVIQKHKDHKRLDVIKTRQNWFVVNHFAGGVQYCSDFFLEKNKDHISNDVVDCMSSSSSSYLSGLFSPLAESRLDKQPSTPTTFGRKTA